MTVLETIQDNLSNTGFDPNSQEFTQHLDSSELSRFFAKYRSEFFLPKVGNIQPEGKTSDRPDDDVIYLVSNSLGLLNKRTKKLIEEELDVWSKKGVFGHFSHDFQRPWKDIDETSLPMMAKVIGAKVLETSIMCTLTANLHFLLNAFYKPTSQKYKILMEDKAFPSDHYAIISQVKQHGFNPDTDIIYLKPRKGEYLIREEDIFNAIEDENLALILLPGVQYYTGQVFPMEEITKLGQSRGVKVGFDLAHAVGNIPLELNKWNVDFACWCTYKYLASGPGNIGGLFVHERYATASEMNRLLGWWAHNPDTRFKMSNQLDLSPGAAGFQLSNPSVTNVVALQGTLSIYNEFDMQMFREQSLLLTDYLELLIKSNSKLNSKIDIMTPEDSTRRGCQLSLLLIEEDVDLVRVYNELLHHGVMTDERHPNCIRVAPYPLINSFQEVREFVAILEKVLIN